jgi:pyruvate,water dikinase
LKLTIPLEDLRKENVSLVGGKNANLGELLNAGMPVPPGFAVTAYAYKKFITENSIGSRIRKAISETTAVLSNPQQFEKVSRDIRELIESTPMPVKIEKAIKKAYVVLGKKTKKERFFVAVRSSATTEDLPDASFAGQHESYLNIRGQKELIETTLKCWSSLFSPRAIVYRTKMGFKDEQVLMSVGVQEMVDARAAGVVFSLNPLTGERGQIVIEANWGFGQSVVSGSTTPDQYIVKKKTLEILEKRVAKKNVEYVHDINLMRMVYADIPTERQEQQCLTDEEIIRLAELAIHIEKNYGGKPQDIEFAIDRDLTFPQNVYVVQSRAETVWSE